MLKGLHKSEEEDALSCHMQWQEGCKSGGVGAEAQLASVVVQSTKMNEPRQSNGSKGCLCTGKGAK